MTERNMLITYEGITADVLDNGAGRYAALVIVAADKQRVIIRMDPQAIIRLQARIAAIFVQRKAFPRLPG
jgi:hypothetical protein